MSVWLIPMRYIAASLIAGFVVPRLEHAFLDEGARDVGRLRTGVLLRR